MSFYTPLKGLTLIELMVALVISAGLTLAVTKVFVQSKHLYHTQQAVSNVSSTASYANFVLERFLRVAGYRKFPESNPYQDPFSDFNSLFTCGVVGGTDHSAIADCQAYEAKDNGTIAVANDTLVVYFQADNGFTQCDNTALPATAITNGELMLHRLSTTGTDLVCQTYNVTTQSEIGNEVTLLNNVVSFQVLYGIGDDNEQTERYVPISFPALSTPNERNKVLSIRVGLLLQSSQNNVQRQAAAPDNIQILDTLRVYPTENRYYVVTTNTTQVRNNDNE